jgi:hypothetical protein
VRLNLLVSGPQPRQLVKFRSGTPVSSPAKACLRAPLFERFAHGWWQRLGRDGLPVMEATAKAKRHSNEQGSGHEFTCMHALSPS